MNVFLIVVFRHKFELLYPINPREKRFQEISSLIFQRNEQQFKAQYITELLSKFCVLDTATLSFQSVSPSN